MSEFRAAYRYALAFIEVAGEAKNLNAVGKDFESLDKLLASSREFSLFLHSPTVNREKKKKIMAELLKSKVSDATYKFVELLLMKNREMLLPEIIRQFYYLRDERLGIVNAIVSVTAPISKEHEQELMTKLESATQKKVRIRYVTDNKLRAGFKVQIGDTIWDGSAAHQLELMRKRFSQETHT